METKMSDLFGSMVFNDDVMKQRLPHATYKEMKKTLAAGKDLTEMEGYDKLTEEEKNAVQLYADFLQQQQDQTLAQYIDFLVKKHQ